MIRINIETFILEILQFVNEPMLRVYHSLQFFNKIPDYMPITENIKVFVGLKPERAIFKLCLKDISVGLFQLIVGLNILVGGDN